MTENHWLKQTLPNAEMSMFVEFDEYMEKVLTQKQAEEVMTKVLSEKKQ